VYRTLFGKLHLKSPRLYRCRCQQQGEQTFSPLAELLVERTAPELLYVESKFAALMSYGLTADVLEHLLPIGRAVHASTLRLIWGCRKSLRRADTLQLLIEHLALLKTENKFPLALL
jgi:hypothetical protein